MENRRITETLRAEKVELAGLGPTTLCCETVNYHEKR